ncbi:histone deacetylase family protein [Thalassospira mesophila]|uniref:Acetylpolyamine aminohydrolase n=1 Tax=Thalassospira mesophila TaxID=1293891 RepID=A0A1Y2L5C4_9PROT|nr:histone deacetylase family protein [Thalassospira mesophila]OSQ40673.1 acetylpolyamine aminohydrolase [Thalassospira mesophila]
MRVFFNARHDAHDVKSEFYHGQTISALDDPRRMGIIRDALAHKIAARLVDPVDHGMAAIRAVHDARYLAFLTHAWQEWVAAGFDGAAVPGAWRATTSYADDTKLYQGDKSSGITRPAATPAPATVTATTATTDPAHDHSHILKKLGQYAYATDTPIGDGSWQAAYWGAQTAISAANAVMKDGEASFCLGRPPGHHAHRARYGGYCLLNNAAIAAQHMRALGAERVAILDIDQDHGDGTQDIFYQRGDVLTVSIHAEPDHHFPFFTGYASETGAGDGAGTNMNIPLAANAGFAGFSAALDQAHQKITGFDADMLVVSLGVNAHEVEPLGTLGLATPDYSAIGQQIGSLGLRTLFVMEGGYAHDVIGQNVAAVLAGYLGTIGG